MRALLLGHTQIVPENLEAIGYRMHPPEAGVTPADELIEAAGRLCYRSFGRPNPATETSQGYMAHILEVGHESIIEHATATIYFEGVSRTLTHELVRHRHLSPSQVSQRYVDERHGRMVLPPVLCAKKHEDLARELARHHEDATRLYEHLADMLVSRGEHRKVANGAARAALLGAHETAIIMTGNLRAWRHVVTMRISPAADDEIRRLAAATIQVLRPLAPSTFQDM